MTAMLKEFSVNKNNAKNSIFENLFSAKKFTVLNKSPVSYIYIFVIISKAQIVLKFISGSINYDSHPTYTPSIIYFVKLKIN